MSNFNLFSDLPFDQFAQRFQREGIVWVFHHIPKTAGTSMVQELRFCFPPYFNIGAAANRDPDAPRRADMLMHGVEMFLDEHPKTQFRSVSGHLHPVHVRRLREGLPHARVFTFLREPVARMISEFRYTRTPKHPTYKEVLAKYPTIESYLDDPDTHNKMWRFVAGRVQRPDETGLTQLFNRYGFIGTLEDYNLCFEFFTALTGHPKTPTTRANVTEKKSENEVEITDDLRARIVETHQDDIAFYNAVTAKLAARRAEMHAFINDRRAQYAGHAATSGG